MSAQRFHTGLFLRAAILAVSFLGCSEQANFILDPSALPNDAYIALNNPRQIIRGFGGANMPVWIDDMTADQVQKAFGTDTGQIGMSILRIRVPYDSTQFHLEVPAAKLAASLGAIVIASPWTPPPSMKSNGNIVGGRLNTGSYAEYAAHLKSFVDYMTVNGIALYAVSLQNEPDVRVTYESCDWSAAELLNFMKTHAPTIGARIIVPESFNFNRSISDPILNDPVACAHVSIIGVHLYGSRPAPYPLAVSKGKEVWMTEHLELTTDWDGALQTAEEIHDCMNSGMSAYLWWYIRRYYGPIDDNGEVTKRGFVMSQYARFVRPGYVRVNATAMPQRDVFVTAYQGGSTAVIVAINHSGAAVAQPFYVQNGALASVVPYVTSGTKNCARGNPISVAGGRFTATLEPRSVTTFVSN